MASITIKNIPERLYGEVKRRAKRNHRSINGEIIYILEQYAGPSLIDPEKEIEQARRIREITAANPLTNSEINNAKDFGRE